jgi:hypothetical protein
MKGKSDKFKSTPVVPSVLGENKTKTTKQISFLKGQERNQSTARRPQKRQQTTQELKNRTGDLSKQGKETGKKEKWR